MTDIPTCDIHADKAIHRGAPLLKISYWYYSFFRFERQGQLVDKPQWLNQKVREAAKKVIFLVAGPLKGGGV